MAVNKNFVVKNGLEVGQNLIQANAATSKVGIGTSTPNYLLHVFGGIGATNIYVSGVVTATSFVGSGASLTGLTGATPGTYGSATEVAQIVVDSNNRITSISNIVITGGGGGGGASTTNTFNGLYVSGLATFTNGPTVLIGSGNSTGTVGQVLQISGISSGAFIGGNLGIGSTNPASKLHVVGNALFEGAGVVTATSFRGSAQIGVQTESGSSRTYIGLTSTISFVGSGITVTHVTGVSGITTFTFTGGGGGGGGSGGVTQIVAGSSGNLIVTPASGVGIVTLDVPSIAGAVGILSGGVRIGVAKTITELNFVGSGVTIVQTGAGTSVNVSIRSSGGASITVGVRVGTAVTFSLVGAGFTVNLRTGAAGTVSVNT